MVFILKIPIGTVILRKRENIVNLNFCRVEKYVFIPATHGYKIQNSFLNKISQIMAEALSRSRDAVCAVAEYLQAIKISEIRQTLEFLGVQHVEVILALLFFIMLQFTKFTAVLMLACMIAYGIFFMVSKH